MGRSGRLCVTSDLHGSIFSTDYITPGLLPVGLLCLAQRFEKDGNTLVLDCGDVLQGTPFCRIVSREEGAAHPMARILDSCGYDAVTLGNHDFNGGLELLQRYLTDLNAPCLCANIRDKAGHLPIRSTMIRTLENGLRIGLTGICTDYLRYWEDPKVVEQLELHPPLEAARAALEQLKGRCDVTVCLYHGGVERDLATGELLSDTGEDLGWAICKELSFDILLTGHQHREIPGQKLFGTWVVQPGCSGGCFAQVEFTVEEDGTVTTASQLVRGSLPLVPPPPAWMQRLEDKTQRWLDGTAAILDRRLEGGNPLELAFHGSAVAELINQMQLAVSGAEISATCLDRYRVGVGPQVRRRDLLAAYRFANTLKMVRISGQCLRKYLERTASYFQVNGREISISPEFTSPKAAHYNYDYLAGVDYTLDLSRPAGERVISLTRDGQEIEKDSSFTLCLTSYRASGGGGYEFIRQCPVLWESGKEISQLLLDYLMEQGQLTVHCPWGLHLRDAQSWYLKVPDENER